jgi:hypothetical protein
MDSVTHVFCKFSLTLVQSVVGWISVILIALGSVPTSAIVRSVWHMRRLNAFSDSFSLMDLMCAISCA